MGVDVLLGLQWGDEGKGKIVDVLCPKYDVIARFQGGPNAGHTLEFNGLKHVLHTIPSGIFHENIINMVGNGVVIDPITLKKEIEDLENLNANPRKNLLISNKAQLILPTHKLLDAVTEKAKGDKKIGSTLRGIGPTYKDKIGRTGIRIGDVFNADFQEKYDVLKEYHLKIAEFHGDKSEINEREWFDAIDFIKELNIVDSELLINQYIKEGKKILAEGAQGSLLDIDFGSYPYVTSSNTITAGACIGLGIAPSKIGKVYGIFKAYCTRVGSGPFPTELLNDVGEQLRKAGNEFGSTTGRPRRCGWLDLPALKYAIMLNDVTELIMTKVDVLNEFENIETCFEYCSEDQRKDIISFSNGTLSHYKPNFKNVPGWNQNLSNINSGNDLPGPLEDYIKYIEKEVEVPVTMLSTGPDRTQILKRDNSLTTANA
ncbi:MAG: adenylosuccinate synthase [Bacteroidetes bacterium]|nr:adenylosuccinate synthase [Bacteroidia bacterium]PCH66421.1 MAG: adenylosuccinate synthase [Bacteroidota bacterium]